jgi:hypothetical protein
VTDRNSDTDSVPEPTAFAEALVCFPDGARARFTSVEFLPDGRLKAVLTRPFTDNSLKDDTRANQYTISETAYFAPGSFVSVQGPPRGFLVADTSSSSVVIAEGILPSEAGPYVERWQGSHGILQPALETFKRPEQLINRTFRVLSESAKSDDYTVTFRWIWPEGHDQPIQQLARVPIAAEPQRIA